MGIPLTLPMQYPFPASRHKEASDNVWATGPHWGRYHGGNDAPPRVKGAAGDPVYPLWPFGEVVFAESSTSKKPGTWGADYGNRILIRHKKRHRHANGTIHWHDWFSFYAHLKTMRPRGGWSVKDNMIGTMGNTGNSTNVHCHFALQLDPGWMVGVVDPHPYLEKARRS